MMRKCILIIILISLFLPCMAKDRCNILYSPIGGYSMLRGDYVISYFDASGNLDAQRVENIAEYIGRYANGVREFPFWVTGEDSHLLQPFGNSIKICASYTENWQKIAEIYNRYNVKLWFSLFDHCNIRNNPSNPWAKWGDTFFYGENAKQARHEFIDGMLKAFNGKVVGFEICNEPRLPLCTPEFLADTFCFLVKKGVEPENIIIGIQYDYKENYDNYAKLYRDFRKLVAKELGNQWEQWLKSRCISPVHNSTLENVKHLLGPNPPKGGTRNFLFSMDGWRDPRPTKKQVKAVVKHIMEAKEKATRGGKIHFEVVYGKTIKDPLDSIEGVIEAYYEFFKEYPENYQRYQDRIKSAKIIWETIKTIIYPLIWIFRRV